MKSVLLLILMLAFGSLALIVASLFGFSFKGFSLPFWILYLGGFMVCESMSSRLEPSNRRLIYRIIAVTHLALAVFSAVAIFLDQFSIYLLHSPVTAWLLLFIGVLVSYRGFEKSATHEPKKFIEQEK